MLFWEVGEIMHRKHNPVPGKCLLTPVVDSPKTLPLQSCSSRSHKDPPVFLVASGLVFSAYGCWATWGPSGPPQEPLVLKAPAQSTFKSFSKLRIRILLNLAFSATRFAEYQSRHWPEYFYQWPPVLLCSVAGKERKVDQENPDCYPRH